MFLTEAARKETGQLKELAQPDLDLSHSNVQEHGVSEADICWWVAHFQMGQNTFLDFIGAKDFPKVGIHICPSLTK